MDIQPHLHDLLSDNSLEMNKDPRLAEEIALWEKSLNLKAEDVVDSIDDAADTGSRFGWETSPTLNIFRSVAGEHAEPAPPAQELSVIQRLRSKPNLETLLPTLAGLLVSDQSDDAISEEVLELLGFDEMDLVSEVLQDRKRVSFELLNSEPRENALVGYYSKGKQRDDQDNKYSGKASKKRIKEALKANAAQPKFSDTVITEAPVYPHVYEAWLGHPALSAFGPKKLLPLGTTREEDEIMTEVVIPPARPIPPKLTERLIPVSELDELARGCFPGYASLNRMQSIIYPTAYTTNENMLICAPTGAGKTDIAMLSILRVLDQNRPDDRAAHTTLGSTIRRDDLKVIYVAPMKALASEIVRKFAKRLAWLSIKVRELTGDMQMTRTEIAETQIIVTTPEKWDVVTRKSTGEGELASKVKLLIIDEVHLLNEERGAVIETIVARTLRQVESSQSVIRIVGLSATLPNYIDVADFLRVSRYAGLFYFDSSFRPVPLEQHFIGVKGKINSPPQKKNLDRITHEKVTELVTEGHQVMVFVHARKETVKSALALKEAVLIDNETEAFDPTAHPRWDMFRREISTSRNKELKELFDFGFGIHHAGMLRSDRNMVEKMFEARAIKVLFCTATLAWGVNLPAHAVLIKGTQVYDSSKGSFVDLSVLDVLQIFGRAGRPGMESSGVGYICTPDEKLDHYLDAVTSQHPIESKFIAGMVDSLNAEISLGTVANVNEAIKWLGYTYLFVRMKKNPMVYGIPYDELEDDPQLGSKRTQLATAAAKKLASARMIRFDERTQAFTITEVGRIAAKYYIRHATIEIFNEDFKPVMSEADVLAVLSRSTEFDQIQVRENELPELKKLEKEIIPCDVKGGTDSSQGKVNILLQAHISKAYVEDFALVSDMAYAAQNGGRIIRALLEIAISRKWAKASTVLMGMSKAVESRMWPFDHPLRQSGLSQNLLHNLEQWADELSVHDLVAHSAAELGKLIHLNEAQGAALLRAAKEFPAAKIACALRPLNSSLLKISVQIERAFTWSNKVHGSIEPFYIWVEGHDGIDILQVAHLSFRSTTQHLNTDFIVAMRGTSLPPYLTIRFVSDKWLGAEEEIIVELDSLVMPTADILHTSTLDLPFLGFKTLRNPALESLYLSRHHRMNRLQTQCFFTVANTKENVLISAPTSSGKGLLAQFAIWRAVFGEGKRKLAVYMTKRKTYARTFAESMNLFRRTGAETQLCLSADELSRPTQRACIKITTASVVISLLSASNAHSLLSALSLVVCDDLESLDATYEVAVSLLLQATQRYPVRFVGLTASLTDPSDLADWLHSAPESTYGFLPADREQGVITATQTFTIPHSLSLFKAMAHPVYTAIRAMPPTESAIVIVSARSLCRSVATQLITQCAVEMEINGFLRVAEDRGRLEIATYRLRDRTLVDGILQGIGILSDGMHPPDRKIVLEMFVDGILPVLILPREMCWMPLKAGLVVVMGTQYLEFKRDEMGGEDRQVANYSIHEVVRMQSLAVRHQQMGRFLLLCQAEDQETFMRFLNQGLPLESELRESGTLEPWVQRRIWDGAIKTKQDVLDVLSFTFLSRRLKSNPTYYDTEPEKRDKSLSRFVDDMWPSPPPHVAPAPDTTSSDA
ncbi:hypothetical protein FRB94_003721 [Tulasnella sp. JGI-2019a]|nr:hypothetical protein FRB94_003721 [Tulasnella sp. JGI-2019a]